MGRIRFFRTPLEIATDGGFRPPAEARRLQEDLEGVEGAMLKLVASLRRAWEKGNEVSEETDEKPDRR